jgi:glycosyltransferase involved in cell wall biosynthesis
LRIIHFHNGKGGGVLSVIKNLVHYNKNTEIENHIIYVINITERDYYQAPEITGVTSASVFYYSPNWNFYYTCKQLAKYIPGTDCVIIAHDWMELGVVTMLGLSNPVIQFLHGDYDYYYQLAVKHASSINGFICVSSTISNKLALHLPNRVKDIVYYPLPVSDVVSTGIEKKGNRIVFAGRCEKEKGYFLLPLIDEQLRKNDHVLEWHIYGEGSLDDEKQQVWPKQSQVTFHGVLPTDNLLRVLPEYDFLVLPTIAEGMPLTVIEAMKAGVVPVVNHLPGGLEELIGSNERGFLVEGNKVEQYVSVLEMLVQNKSLVQETLQRATVFANERFDPVKCTAAIEQFIITNSKACLQKPPKKVYGSRLDQKWLPNAIVTFIRNFKFN